MKKIVISVVAILMSASIYAQTNGTIGKNTYPILGKYTGKCSLGSSSFNPNSDSVYYYSKIVNDTLLATHIIYRKGVITEVKNYRIKYQHQNINITKPEEYFKGEYKVVLEVKNSDASSLKVISYTEKGADNWVNPYSRCYNFFPNKEAAEKFYNNLMSGTSMSAEPITQVNTSSQSTQVKAEAQEVKIKIKNTGSDVAEMYYQKSPGSKDNYSFRVQKGQSADLKINVGCSLFFNVKGGRGPLILTATNAMDGTTQVVK